MIVSPDICALAGCYIAYGHFAVEEIAQARRLLRHGARSSYFASLSFRFFLAHLWCYHSSCCSEICLSRMQCDCLVLWLLLLSGLHADLILLFLICRRTIEIRTWRARIRLWRNGQLSILISLSIWYERQLIATLCVLYLSTLATRQDCAIRYVTCCQSSIWLLSSFFTFPFLLGELFIPTSVCWIW